MWLTPYQKYVTSHNPLPRQCASYWLLHQNFHNHPYLFIFYVFMHACQSVLRTVFSFHNLICLHRTITVQFIKLVEFIHCVERVEVNTNNKAVYNRNQLTATESTCHMGSHSITCHPAAVTFPPLPHPKLVLDLVTQSDARLSWPGLWLHPKIVYLPKTVTYLRNNQAVSWPGLEPATRKLEVCRPNHYTTEPPYKAL